MQVVCDPFNVDIGASPNQNAILQIREHMIPDVDLSSFDPPEMTEFNSMVLTPPPMFPDN